MLIPKRTPAGKGQGEELRARGEHGKLLFLPGELQKVREKMKNFFYCKTCKLGFGQDEVGLGGVAVCPTRVSGLRFEALSSLSGFQGRLQ